MVGYSETLSIFCLIKVLAIYHHGSRPNCKEKRSDKVNHEVPNLQTNDKGCARVDLVAD